MASGMALTGTSTVTLQHTHIQSQALDARYMSVCFIIKDRTSCSDVTEPQLLDRPLGAETETGSAPTVTTYPADDIIPKNKKK